MTDFAFVAAGRLHASLGGAAPRALESAYADSVRDRAHDIHRRHSWKGESAIFRLGLDGRAEKLCDASAVDAIAAL